MQKSFQTKITSFCPKKEHPARYQNVKKFCTKIQRKAFADYNKQLSVRLDSMEKSDRRFWDLTKKISELQQSRIKAARSADDLVDHFASKMSNAAEMYDNVWNPPEHWNDKANLSSFKVSQMTVLEWLKSHATYKSIKRIPYLMLKECAHQLVKPLTKLYQYICKRGEFPTRCDPQAQCDLLSNDV